MGSHVSVKKYHANRPWLQKPRKSFIQKSCKFLDIDGDVVLVRKCLQCKWSELSICIWLQKHNICTYCMRCSTLSIDFQYSCLHSDDNSTNTWRRVLLLFVVVSRTWIRICDVTIALVASRLWAVLLITWYHFDAAHAPPLTSKWHVNKIFIQNLKSYMSDLKWYINNFIFSKAMLCMIDIQDNFKCSYHEMNWTWRKELRWIFKSPTTAMVISIKDVNIVPVCIHF